MEALPVTGRRDPLRTETTKEPTQAKTQGFDTTIKRPRVIGFNLEHEALVVQEP